MNYTASHIRSILGTQDPLYNSEFLIEEIVIDSRAITHGATTLFVALEGNIQDGHDFVGDAYKSGTRNFLVSKRSGIKDINEFMVEDVLDALQKIAKYHRSQCPGIIVGITGSNGKTTVKEWLYHLLPSNLRAFRSPMSFNSQIGVPLSVLRISDTDDVAIIEAGISRPLEMKKLSEIISCDIGIFTMIGDAHSAGFQDRQTKLEEKLSLFESCQTLIYNRDQEEVHRSILRRYSDKKTVSISFSEGTNASISFDYTASLFSMTYGQKKINIPFNPMSLGDAHNMSLAIASAIVLEVELGDIFERLIHIDAIPMRLETDIGKNGAIIINDSYSADIASLKMALEHVKLQGIDRKKIVVISEFLDVQNSLERLQQIASLMEQYQIDEVHGVGPNMKALTTYMSNHILYKHYDSVSEVLAHGQPLIRRNDIVLIKGARRYHFEKLFLSLTTKLHETVLEIELNALGHNLGLFSKSLNPNTKIMAMVKASAYGAGLIEIARYLEFRNIDYLGVAFIDEGIQLRQAGIRLPIFVLLPDVTRIDDVLQFDLEIAINSLEYFRAAIADVPKDQEVKIHLNLDSGMNRLGFKPIEVAELIQFIDEHHGFDVIGIFSHLAVSDDIEQAGFSESQNQLFLDASSSLLASGKGQVLRHLLNTAGIIHFPSMQYDMVRLGIGLYGVSGDIVAGEQLDAVFTLKTVIKGIRDINKGDSVGYGRTWKAKRNSKIASLPLGYADGFMRNSGLNGFEVSIHGQLAPIVGHICMDITMIDVTDIRDVKLGDEVIIFDQNRPLDVLAKANNTIPYEVISRLSDRIKRLYIR